MTADALGGVWPYALDLAHALRPLGIATTLAVLGPPPSAAQTAEAAGVDLRHTGLPLDWLAAGRHVVERTATHIAALARDTGADIIHLNTPALAGVARFSAPVLAVCHSCVRTWWDAVECGSLPPSLAWQAKLIAKGYAAANQLVAPSAAFAQATQLAYRLPCAPLVVPNGRHALELRNASPGEFIFTAGRLWDRGKNIAALEPLAAALPWPVLAAGSTEGPDGSAIHLRHVRTLGALSAAHLANHLARTPIFISLARYEPFGLAVLEAAQAGCPLVLADTAGFRELWDGAALFVPLDDDAAAVAAVRGLIADPQARRHAGQAAAAHAARYSATAMAQRMLQLYRALAGLQAAA